MWWWGEFTACGFADADASEVEGFEPSSRHDGSAESKVFRYYLLPRGLVSETASGDELRTGDRESDYLTSTAFPVAALL
jgi:hypothetical protein